MIIILLGVEEVRRKYFGTLYNTYSFFALYANVDGFTISGKGTINGNGLRYWKSFWLRPALITTASSP
ncbi:hypothetical protein D0T60_18785 [Bacteroides sp. 224]|nr:hypothetical protein [Bacteroides sp. 224]